MTRSAPGAWKLLWGWRSLGWGQKVCPHTGNVHWPGPGELPGVPCLPTKEEEEDGSMWPHAGCGAGEENDMGRVAP